MRTAWQRAWNATLGWHLAALAVVLVVVALIVGTEASFSSDEGAAIAQARQLRDGQGWITPNPFPEIDPKGLKSFLALSEHGTKGTTPYAKHFAYPVVLAAVGRFGDVNAMVALSIVGAVLAAWAAARLAVRLDSRLERPALWATGIGSPLLFDSQLVIAHTIGAACVGGAVLALVRARERQRLFDAGIAALLLLVGTLFRTEVALLAVTIAVTVVVLDWSGSRLRTGATAVALVGAAAAAVLLDRVVLSRIIGSSVRAVVPVSAGSEYLSARLSGLFTMTVLPGDSWPVIAQVTLVASLVAAIAAAVLARTTPMDDRAFRWACAVAIGASVAVVLGGSPDTIPSLGMAAPLVPAGLCCLTRSILRDPLVRLLGISSAAFAVIVVVVQYNQAGAAEWGARFLAVTIPMLIPVVLLALLRTGERLEGMARRWGLVALLVLTITRSGLAVWSLDHYHGLNLRYVERVSELAAGWSPEWRNGAPATEVGEMPTDRPVVVTTWLGLGRLMGNEPPVWGLTVEPGAVREVASQLRDAGAARILFVTNDPRELKVVEGLYDVEPTRFSSGPAYRLRAKV